MTEDQLNIWLKALESGRYEQGRERLRRTDGDTGGPPLGYCCLGVYCDSVLVPAGKGQWDEEQDVFVYNTASPLEDCDEFAPSAEIPQNVQEVLSQLNDGGDPANLVYGKPITPYNFKQIADFIRKNAVIDPATKLVSWPTKGAMFDAVA